MENLKENIKFCPACGAENKENYVFCNICGANLKEAVDQSSQPLTAEEVSKSNYTYPSKTADEQPTISFTPVSAAAGTKTYIPKKCYINAEGAVGDSPDFDDVTAAEMFEYTGYQHKLFAIMQKLHFIPGSNKFSWTLLLCGLLFGFFGMSMWYLYHKVYKHAYIFLGVSIVVLGAELLGTYLLFGSILENLPKIINDVARSVPFLVQNDFSTLGDLITDIFEITSTGFVFLIISSVLSFVAFIFAIVMPFSAYKTYKKCAIDRIRREKSAPGAKILSIGGFNKVATIIISIVFFLVSSISFSALSTNFAADAFDYYERNQERIQEKFTYTDEELSGHLIIESDFDNMKL